MLCRHQKFLDVCTGQLKWLLSHIYKLLGSRLNSLEDQRRAARKKMTMTGAVTSLATMTMVTIVAREEATKMMTTWLQTPILVVP